MQPESSAPISNKNRDSLRLGLRVSDSQSHKIAPRRRCKQRMHNIRRNMQQHIRCKQSPEYPHEYHTSAAGSARFARDFRYTITLKSHRTCRPSRVQCREVARVLHEHQMSAARGGRRNCERDLHHAITLKSHRARWSCLGNTRSSFTKRSSVPRKLLEFACFRVPCSLTALGA
jgi:hypothetical protein